jgi:dTDP-glucose 4,6-dehydratase
MDLTTNQTLLVTGGCGFIGSHFINHILETYSGVCVVNVDCLNYCAAETNVDQCWRDPLCSRYTFVKGNINDATLILNLLRTHRVSAVVHFAAQSHVQNSFTDMQPFIEDNIKGTQNLLECCRQYGQLERFVHVSTDEVYGESTIGEEGSLKTEESILFPTNPYAATKASAEMIVHSYCHSYNLPVIITRGNNVFGPNQYPEKVIPRFIQLLKNNKKLTIQGTGSAVRAFLHASDTARAFDIILRKGDIGHTYNIGCDKGMEYSVLEVAKMLIEKVCGTTAYGDWLEYVEDRPFNDQRYYISNEKLKALGWSIRVPFEEGLAALVQESG